jgi:hypothetical protein
MARLVASSLLVVLAAASVVLAAVAPLGAWATGSRPSAGIGMVGTVSVLIACVLALAYAALTAYAALQEWRARPVGRMLGLAAALVAALAALTALLTGEFAESAVLLLMAIGLGSVTALVLLLPRKAP